MQDSVVVEIIPDADIEPRSERIIPSTEFTLAKISKEFNKSDLRSALFLLLDSKFLPDGVFKPIDFLHIVKKNADLEQQFRRLMNMFPSKETILIEILGTMQKHKLLKLSGTCRHKYLKDQETYTGLNALWKCLYQVCEQLNDSDISDLKKEILHNSNTIGNIICAEQLFCEGYNEKLFSEKDISKLLQIFVGYKPLCAEIIRSYKYEALTYYPIKQPTNAFKCGICVIFNHTKFKKQDSFCLQPRQDSNVDVGLLKELWESFGFIVKVYEDQTVRQVYNIFSDLANSDHSSYDAFIACYLSHGDKNVVYSHDSQPIDINSLLYIISNQCQTLVGKPKLFFVQACQGKDTQTGIAYSQFPIERIAVTETTLTKNTPEFSDCFVLSATIEGFVSYRSVGSGSWFIKELVEAFIQYGDKLSVSSTVPKIKDSVSKKSGSHGTLKNLKQTVNSPFNTLRHELRFKKMN